MGTKDVGLTGTESAATETADPDPDLVEPTEPAGTRRARAPGQDAKALQARAEHQVRRIRRKLVAARRTRRARVLVVDDSSAFRDVATSLVSAAPSLRLVGLAASGAEAIELLPQLKPDLVLLDFRMPGMDGIETARIVRQERPDALVVLVSAVVADLEPAARAAGAAAVLGKHELCPDTLEALWAEHGRDAR